MQHNLKLLGTGHELASLVRDFMQHYPDPYRLARQYGANILREHTGKAWDPDQVWWHEFDNAHSSSRTVTGWAHCQAPVRSMRFTQLVVERFKLAFQEEPDLLDDYGGFYRHGPHADCYDERNEVKLRGQDVQQALWALDFASVVRRQVQTFWSERSSDFQVLAKVSLLAQCLSAEQRGLIEHDDARHLRSLAVQGGQPAGQAVTLALLRRKADASAVTLDSYHPAGAGRVWMYVLQMAGGRVVLYLPYDEQPLRGFESMSAMAGWFRALLRSRSGMQRVLASVVADPGLTVEADDAREALQCIAQSADAQAALAGMAAVFHRRSGELFTVLAEDAAQNMQHNAKLLASNWLLREAIASDYLNVVIRFAVYFAPVVPGLPLLVLASSLLKLYFDSDLAAHARTRAQRDAAVVSAMLDAIFSALGMVEINAAGQTARASLAYRPAYHEIDAAVEGWQVAESPEIDLAGQEDNAVLFGEPSGQPALKGILVGPDGTCHIELNGQPYRVRYSTELNHWLIVDPDKPYAFAPIRPVRLNEGGQWQLLERPRLAGGAPGAKASAFWDEYMRTDEVRSESISRAALDRHIAMLDEQDIFELPAKGEPSLDDEDFDYADNRGVKEYTFKHDGRYRNHLIEVYTSDDSINEFLREGKREFIYGDPVDYLDKLLDSMEMLPGNAEKPLFRGGNGERGTSGAHFRNGDFKVGDTLVNTDLTSFTENPYIVRDFAADTEQVASSGIKGVFDDTSVVFELPAERYDAGVKITALSGLKREAETLFAPGHYFCIEAIDEVIGADYRFINVKLRQVKKPASGPVFDLRTGQPFDRHAYIERLGDEDLVERFFPN